MSRKKKSAENRRFSLVLLLVAPTGFEPVFQRAPRFRHCSESLPVSADLILRRSSNTARATIRPR